MHARRTAVLILLTCGLVHGFPQHASAADTRPDAPSATEVRSALKAFKQAERAKDAGARIEAVQVLAAYRHPKVAKALLKSLRKEKDDEVLRATAHALRGFRAYAKDVAPPLAERLAREAKAAAERAARGDPGVRTDPRTGDVDADSAEGRARLLAGRKQAAWLATLLGTLDALDWEGVRIRPDLTPLLQSPDDDLVVAVLARLASTHEGRALPALLALYRMYPTDASWETGAVVDLAGTNASAKAKWMVLFGHPDKQRARPRVHTALMETLQAIAGRAFASPDALATFLQGKEARALVKTTRKRR